MKCDITTLSGGGEMERAREQLLFFSGQSLNQKYEYENMYGKGETQEESS